MTLGEEIMKIIGAWLNTDGNLIDLYGMHDKFSRKYLIRKEDTLWNGRNDYKYIKAKITNQKRETLIGINKSNELINFEITLEDIKQFNELTSIFNYKNI
jgi:hypothetical protein